MKKTVPLKNTVENKLTANDLVPPVSHETKTGAKKVDTAVTNEEPRICSSRRETCSQCMVLYTHLYTPKYAYSPLSVICKIDVDFSYSW